ncbi:MAG: CoA transferase [Rhodobacterales bacterium]|nr:MAG: CoA transferase [Rhodobacterales bacterium]
MSELQGPLKGLKVVEIAGLGPTPFAAMWLADMGAEVVRIERPGLKPLFPQNPDFLNRGRGFAALDLKTPADRDIAARLIARADLLIEGMRPGVMERLGLGPDEMLAANPKLIYGRMTGWGQTGPLAPSAGHDINYISITGALHAIGSDAPVPPLNLVGDFGGGAMYLVAGLLAALHHAGKTGEGQVVDCAISDGTAHLSAMIYSLYGSGLWADAREANLLDGGAPFYRTYRCACGGYIAVAPLEEKFYQIACEGLGLSDLPDRADPANWPALRTMFETAILEKTRDEWTAIFEGTDACISPVLSLSEAPDYAHNRARQSFVALDGTQPNAAPALSKTPGKPHRGEEKIPLEIDPLLARWGG